MGLSGYSFLGGKNPKTPAAQLRSLHAELLVERVD
jgi:hypothetical protein